MFEEMADKFKSLGHPTRIQIVSGLLNNECSVNKISEGLNLPQAVVSRHLSILKHSGIIHGVRSGNLICYHVCDKKIAEMFNVILGGVKECTK